VGKETNVKIEELERKVAVLEAKVDLLVKHGEQLKQALEALLDIVQKGVT